VAKPAKYLIVGSTEAYSGKSAIILGITHHLAEQGVKIAYGKPLGTCLDENLEKTSEKDVNFLQESLGLSAEQVQSPLLRLDSTTIGNRLQGKDSNNYSQALQQYITQLQGEIVLLEGPETLWEGSLFSLSTGDIAEAIDASIVLVSRYDSLLCVANFLTAKKILGNRLIGVVINDIPPPQLAEVASLIKPYLEQQNIPLLGMIPQDKLLNSVRVRELAKRLDAKVLCRSDRLDLMVESLSIGAMNVNSALEFFRQRENMAVVTGGDRAELQMAALETSTHCLILTGHTPPQPFILSRAEDLEVPVLAVDFDTLTTVEIVDNCFGKVPIHEPIKVKRMRELMAQYFDFERLRQYLDVEQIPLTANN
jgi:BioD-like phosphotransacetylase family protein